MKRASLLVIIILASVIFVAVPPARCGDGKVERWILVVGGTTDNIPAPHQTLLDTYYFYHVLVHDIKISTERARMGYLR